MTILFYELKKALYYRKGLQALICFFALFVTTLILMDSPVNPQAEYYKQEYNHYLDILEGVSNEEKINFLESESLLIAQTKISLEKLYDEYYNGAILESEFNEKLQQYQDVLENQNGFEIIYKQFLYVNENVDARYFTYVNGWHSLLTNNYTDYILIMLVIILVIPILCHEYTTKMNNITITTKYGSNISMKILVSTTLAVVISSLSSIIKYLFCNIKYGLSSGQFPLESVEYFANTTKQISLIDTFFTLSIIRLIGFILLTTIILFICTLIKKTSVCVFLSVLIIFLPELLFNQNIKNMLPLPTSLIFNSSIFKGEQTEIDVLTKEVVTIFSEVSLVQIITMVAGSLLISILLLLVTLLLNKNKLHRKYKIKGMKALWIVSVICLTGCSSDDNINVSYNTVDKDYAENANYIFSINEESGFKPVFTDKNSTQQYNLMSSPLASDIRFNWSLYADGKYAYYVYYTDDKSDIRFTETQKITFMRVDLDTFDEMVYFEKNLSGSEKWDILHSFSSFFIQGNNLYIMGSAMYKINTTISSIEMLDINVIGNVAFDGRNIFYIGEKSNLYSFDTVTNISDVYNDIVASTFCLTESRILYANRKDGNTLYIYDKEKNMHEKIFDGNVSFFAIRNGGVQITTKTGYYEIFISDLG